MMSHASELISMKAGEDKMMDKTPERMSSMWRKAQQPSASLVI